MDPVTTVYYAVVCGCLGVVSGWVPGRLIRLIGGAAVGVAAAVMLPQVRAALGV